MPRKEDYILVRDKNGQLKYYKDGQFYDLDEIDQPKPTKQQIKVAKPISEITIKPSQEDEELEAEAKQFDQLETVRSQLNNKIQNTVNDIINELKISFVDENIKKRFDNLVASRLRNIRSDKEARYMMTVPKDEGGLGLDGVKADLIVSVSKKHEEALNKEKRGLAVQAPENLSQKVMAPVSQPIKKTLPAASDQAIEKTISLSKKPIAVTAKSQPSTILISDEKPWTPNQSKVGPIRRQAQSQATKPVADIKYRPRLYGPLEELQTLDLTNFRRLGAGPEQITQEIKEKIELLRQESFDRGFEGVAAWRQSPVYQIYTEIGVESIMSGKSIEQVIIDRQVKNLPVLTLSEFEAIIKLNKELVV